MQISVHMLYNTENAHVVCHGVSASGESDKGQTEHNVTLTHNDSLRLKRVEVFNRPTS